jgi:hypothetical protein
MKRTFRPDRRSSRVVTNKWPTMTLRPERLQPWRPHAAESRNARSASNRPRRLEHGFEQGTVEDLADSGGNDVGLEQPDGGAVSVSHGVKPQFARMLFSGDSPQTIQLAGSVHLLRSTVQRRTSGGSMRTESGIYRCQKKTRNVMHLFQRLSGLTSRHEREQAHACEPRAARPCSQLIRGACQWNPCRLR